MSIFSVYFLKKEDSTSEKRVRAVNSLEEFINLRSTRKQHDLMTAARGGDETAKRRLQQFCYNFVAEDNTKLTDVCMLGNSFCFDYDGQDVQGVINRIMELKDQLGLLMLERSTHGVHGVFLRQPGLTILENQYQCARLIGCEWDTNTHDINRVFFASTESTEDLLFTSPSLFNNEIGDAEAKKAEYQSLLQREANGEEVLPADAHNGKKHVQANVAPVQQKVESTTTSVSAQPSQSGDSRQQLVARLMQVCYNPDAQYGNIKYSAIFEQYWKAEYGHEPYVGSRHASILKAAKDFAFFCEFNPEKVMEIMPRLGKSEQEVAEAIVDSLNWQDMHTRGSNAPQKLTNIIKCMEQISKDPWSGQPYPTIAEANLFQLSMPEQPKFVDEMNACLPPFLHYTAEVAASLVGMTLAQNVRVKMGDFPETTLSGWVHVDGPATSGKGWVLTPAKELLKPLAEESKLNEQLDVQYHAAIKRAEADKTGKVKRPEEKYFPIRVLPPATTRNEHIERMKNGDMTITLTDEIDELTMAQKKPAYARQSFYRLLFMNEPTGSRAFNGLGVNITCDTKWNILSAGTHDALVHAFPREDVNNGTITRLVQVLMPNTIGHQSEYSLKEYTPEQKKNIRRAAELLMMCKGLTRTPKLAKALNDWYRMKENELRDDFEALQLLGRQPLKAFRFGNTLHLYWGVQAIMDKEQKIDRRIDRFEKKIMKLRKTQDDDSLEIREARAQIEQLGKDKAALTLGGSIDVSRFKENDNMIATTIMMVNNMFDVQCMLWKKTMKQRNETEFADVDTSKSTLMYDERIKLIPDGVITYDVLYGIFPNMSQSTVRMMVKKMLDMGMLTTAPGSKPKSAKFMKVSA